MFFGNLTDATGAVITIQHGMLTIIQCYVVIVVLAANDTKRYTAITLQRNPTDVHNDIVSFV
jgi:hypothetical protein